jgi:hypothetical protein
MQFPTCCRLPVELAASMKGVNFPQSAGMHLRVVRRFLTSLLTNLNPARLLVVRLATFQPTRLRDTLATRIMDNIGGG